MAVTFSYHDDRIASADENRDASWSFHSRPSGNAVVTLDKAALWTDGRYFLQASKQLDANWILMKANIQGTPSRDEWLKDVSHPEKQNVPMMKRRNFG
jgi:Xaa-Pro aminopeptidase